MKLEVPNSDNSLTASVESDTHCNSSVVRFAPKSATQDSYTDILALLGEEKGLRIVAHHEIIQLVF